MDGKISVKLLVWILVIVFIYGALRNIPGVPVYTARPREGLHRFGENV